MIARKISVVLPVYNEAENIQTCLRRLAAALAGVEHEILVCYDFEADTTLPAIAAMTDRPASLKLVRNDLGKGAANALRAGFKAATGDVVVTTMADLSDPPEKIPELAEHLRAGGYAVVAGSRYMRGGSQTGGPFLKRTFSRWAGLLLRWIAGLGTHDATNNFRAYSRSFLDSVGIESERGFEIALELTVKAQQMGLRVGEIPSSWTDRSAGASRFRMWAWMPNYLRWWLRAAREPLIVWGTWALMVVLATLYIRDYAPRIPFWDDLEVLRIWLPTMERNWEEMWSLHNEHRIPLPRLIQVGLLHATNDFRSGMCFQVLLYGLVSAAMILVARRVRGRTSWTDAFFPLLWLNTGNCENLLMGFQLSLALPTILVCVFLVLAVLRPQGLGVGASVIAALSLVSLPLCGGPGLTQVPPLILGTALLGWLTLKRKIQAPRAAGWVLISGAVLTVIVVVLYFVDFTYAPGENKTRDPLRILEVALKFLSLSAGHFGRDQYPWSIVLILAIVAIGAGLCVQRLRFVAPERLRAGGVLMVMGATAFLALGIGHGRGGGDPSAGFAVRYIGLPAPILCAAYFAVLLYGGMFTSAIVRGVLVLGMTACLIFVEDSYAHGYGRIRRDLAAAMQRDIRAGTSSIEVFNRYGKDTYPAPPGFFYLFGLMAQYGVPPFDDLTEQQREDWNISAFRTPPSYVESPDGKARVREVGEGFMALLAPPRTGVHMPLNSGSTRISGLYGVMPANYKIKKNAPVRIMVMLIDGDTREVLLDRVLDPVNEPNDRGPQKLDLTLPHPGQEIVLRTLGAVPHPRPVSWAYWAQIAVE